MHRKMAASETYMNQVLGLAMVFAAGTSMGIVNIAIYQE
jgi:hypothetical protein